jgi:cobalt-zinc-cadmium resistance protein CzcA
MLNRILFFSIHNKVIVGLGLLGLILWGSFSALKLPIDAVPDITNNQVQIITNSPSLSPTEVERLITAPLELQFSNMPDLQELRSISRFGLSVITAVFSDETEVYKARQMVSERLATAGELIPPSLGQPEMGPVSTGLGEIFQYVVRPKPGFESRYSLSDLRTLQDWTIRRALLGTPGVADVSSFGGHVAQFDVVFKPENLRRFNVSVQTLFEALQQNNANAGGAYIARGPQAWYIRTEGLVYNLEQIRDIPIQTNTQSVPVRVRDLAEVRMGQAIRYGALTLSDKGEGVGGIVLMLKGENSGKVTQDVEDKMEEIWKMLPPGLEIEVYLNRTHLVDRAISTVRNNLIEGALIVIFVLVLLLGNVRAGLIVASVIPLSLLFAIGMMQAFGVSGNLMSLGAIDFGLIVDGAVILVEATLHHLNRLPKDTLVARTMDEEVFTATSRIRNSAAFGEIIILIVYLPLLALVGIEGKMFRPMAQTVAFAIAGAFILSLTWVPMASALFLRPDTRHKPTWSDRFIDALYRGYVPILNALIRRGKIVVFVSLLGMAGAFFLFFQLGGEFIPSLDEGDFAVETRLLPGTSLEKTIEVSQQAAKLLKAEFPEVRGVIGKIGTSEIPTDPMPFEACDLMVLLHDKSTWVSAETKSELAEKMQAKLAVIPGVTFGFQQPIQMRFNELMTGARQDVAIKVFGHDMELLASTATRLGRSG